MELRSFSNNEINICHFQGRSFYAYSAIFNNLLDRELKLDDDISIISCYNNAYNAILFKQLNKNGINLINGFNKIDKSWDNVDKIGYVLNALQHTDSEICLICDGNDVLVNTFNGLLDKFKSIGYRILFNATTNNHPDILIDKVKCRDFYGRFRFFNAGCCIGYRSDLIKFYTECLEFLSTNPYNPWKSEQLILRNVFAKYSEDENNKFIGYDHDCVIFQTFANTRIEKDGDKFRVL